MEAFGCCSSYAECSDKKICLHAEDPVQDYVGYRVNLEAGRIFYGNTPEDVPDADTHTTVEAAETDKSVFLHCMNRLFAIYARRKDQYSTTLTPEQVQKIEAAFDNAGIPYKPCIDDMSECIIDMPTQEDPTPANSRVVFAIDGEEFHLLNYNSWLIKRSTAEKIAKAFDNHFITARVELRGKYANVNTVDLSAYQTKPVQRPMDPEKVQKINAAADAAETVEVQKNKPATQVSVFELCAKQLLDEIQDTGGKIQKINAVVSVPAPVAVKSVVVPESIDYEIPADLIGESRGSIVIADDKYCGAYLGELVNYRVMPMQYKFIHVRIIKMLRYPRQDAILNPMAEVKREPYPVGSEQTFNLAEIRFVFDAGEKVAV